MMEEFPSGHAPSLNLHILRYVPYSGIFNILAIVNCISEFFLLNFLFSLLTILTILGIKNLFKVFKMKPPTSLKELDAFSSYWHTQGGSV